MSSASYNDAKDNEGNLLQLGTSLASLPMGVLIRVDSNNQPPNKDYNDVISG